MAMRAAVMSVHALQFFYKGNKLSTLYTSAGQHTIVSANNQNLYETTSQTSQTRLLATDAQDSTVITESESQAPLAYSPFGHDSCPPASPILSRFTGQSWLPSAIGYLLGNGHRLFNPGLMRFHSADGLSPFGNGGLNAYAYCGNDPINRSDPSGKSFIKRITRQYSYDVLAPRLKKVDPSFTANEYKALGNSIHKRLKRNFKYFDEGANVNLANGQTLQGRIGEYGAQRNMYLKLQQTPKGRYTYSHKSPTAIHEAWQLQNAALVPIPPSSPPPSRRASIVSALFQDVPRFSGPRSSATEQPPDTLTSEFADNQVPEHMIDEDLQERLRSLRQD